MSRVTCARYDGSDHARAATVPHDDRPGYLTASGWRRDGADAWRHPHRAAAYSTAAAVREALREEVGR